MKTLVFAALFAAAPLSAWAVPGMIQEDVLIGPDQSSSDSDDVPKKHKEKKKEDVSQNDTQLAPVEKSVPLPPPRPHFESDAQADQTHGEDNSAPSRLAVPNTKKYKPQAVENGVQPSPKAPKKKVAVAPATPHCISSLDGASAADKAVISRMETSAGGSLSSGVWKSRGAEGDVFSFSPTGPLVMTVLGLQNKGLDALAVAASLATKGEPVDPNVRLQLRGMLAQGSIQFNANLCIQANGNFYLNLVGSGMANGYSGQIALVPSKGHISASGNIAGTELHETLANASH